MGIQDCKPVSTPAEMKIDDDTTAALGKDEHAQFCRVIGKVMYASVEHSDVAFTVKELARRLASPTGGDWLHIKRLLRYLKSTASYVLRLTGHDMDNSIADLNVYANANWASGPSRRSTSRGCAFFRRTCCGPGKAACPAYLGGVQRVGEAVCPQG
eukprot:16442545-Heterocapsa_arctica.AAC.1